MGVITIEVPQNLTEAHTVDSVDQERSRGRPKKEENRIRLSRWKMR